MDHVLNEAGKSSNAETFECGEANNRVVVPDGVFFCSDILVLATGVPLHHSDSRAGFLQARASRRLH